MRVLHKFLESSFAAGAPWFLGAAVALGGGFAKAWHSLAHRLFGG